MAAWGLEYGIYAVDHETTQQLEITSDELYIGMHDELRSTCDGSSSLRNLLPLRSSGWAQAIAPQPALAEDTIGALMIGEGFGGPVYYNFDKEPPK